MLIIIRKNLSYSYLLQLLIIVNSILCCNNTKAEDPEIKKVHTRPYTDAPAGVDLGEDPDPIDIEKIKAIYILSHLFSAEFGVESEGQNIFKERLKIERKRADEFLRYLNENKYKKEGKIYAHKFGGRTKEWAESIKDNTSDIDREELSKSIFQISDKIRKGGSETVNISDIHDLHIEKESVKEIIEEVFNKIALPKKTIFYYNPGKQNADQTSEHIWTLPGSSSELLNDRINNDLNPETKKLYDAPDILIIAPEEKLENSSEDPMRIIIQSSRFDNSSKDHSYKLTALSVPNEGTYIRIDDSKNEGQDTWYKCGGDNPPKVSYSEVKKVTENENIILVYKSE